MNMDLKNQSVLITGSSTGIGFACLELFVKNDWDITQ